MARFIRNNSFNFLENGSVILKNENSSITQIEYNGRTYLIKPDKKIVKKILDLFLEDVDMVGIINTENMISKIYEKL